MMSNPGRGADEHLGEVHTSRLDITDNHASLCSHGVPVVYDAYLLARLPQLLAALMGSCSRVSVRDERSSAECHTGWEALAITRLTGCELVVVSLLGSFLKQHIRRACCDHGRDHYRRDRQPASAATGSNRIVWQSRCLPAPQFVYGVLLLVNPH